MAGDSGMAGKVALLLWDWLVLQVPARALLEGDTVTLRCRGWQDSLVTLVFFFRDGNVLATLHGGTELSLSPLEMNHSGHYHCGSWLDSWDLKESAEGKVTVQELKPVLVLEGPPELPEGSPLSLSCLSTPSPLRPPAPLLYHFYRDGKLVGGPQGSPQLLVPAVGVSHSGNYSCVVHCEWGTVWKSSARLGITLRMPVANATITPSSPALQVTPLLEVTPQGTAGHRWSTVAAGLGWSLLYLLLFVAGAVGWHRWNSMAARKQQERAPPEPPTPPEEGEVLYTHVVSTKQPGASPRATTLQDPQVTYAELPATHGRPRECGDIYGNVL